MRFLVARLFLGALALSLAACGSSGGNSTAAAPVTATPPPAGKDWTQVVSQTDQGFVMGNPAAPIKLVEYGSRLCPTCGAFATQGYAPLTENYVKTGKVSFEFREFLVHGPPDMAPALLGRCVGADAFFPMLEQMFANQAQFTDRWQHMTPAQQQQIVTAPPADAFRLWAENMGLIDFVKERGLPEAQARACIANAGEIDKMTKQTQDNGPGPAGNGTVTGTPTFLLNGEVAEGVVSWPAMEQALKRAGA